MTSFRIPLVLLVACLLLVSMPLVAQDVPRELTFDVLFGDAPGGDKPSDRQWSPDGTRLSYTWDDGLWVLDVATGEKDQVLDVEDLELDEYVWAPDGNSLLLLAGGDLHLLPLADGELRRLTETEAEEEDPKFSPDGSRVAFVRQANLHLLDLETGTERALTTDGEPNELLNGITDWVYWEELWGRDSTGHWWSPDGSKIAYYQFDETPVGIYTLLDHLPKYPEVEEQRHPKAGTDNPKVRVGVLDLASGETTWLDTGPDPTEYLARVHWRPSDSKVAVHRINRDQTRLDLLLCDPTGGDCSTLLTETHPTWINLEKDFHFLPDGRFLWGSERSGWRHVYLYAADGSLIRRLTAGEGSVTSVDAVEPDAGHVVYTLHAAGTLGTARREIHRVSLDGGEPEVLTSEPGWHSAEVAPKTGHWIHAFSTADQPQTLTLRRADGSTVDLPSTPPPYDPDELPSWEMFQIDGPGGLKLPARRLLPAGLDPANPTKKYPVIMYHYGCPSHQVVVDRWSNGRDLWHKMMAQRGFMVLAVDNETSAFFGKAGEDKAHRRFGPLNLKAQQAGVEYLKSLPWVDPERIGLWGWSGGGSNTLYCLLNAPNTWKAGVAGAPVTDWLLYDTIWIERYLDHPDDNPEGYEASSPVTYAENLDDALLIVHGTADDNVHPQNTLVMSHALVEAGKPFEQAIYPGQKHGIRGASERHFYEKMTAFFERELGDGGL